MDRFDWIEVKDDFETPPLVDTINEPDFHPFKVARKMRASGHFRAAVAHYKIAITQDASNYKAWREIIDTLVRARQLEHAQDIAAKAKALYPDVARLFPSQALVLLHTNRLEQAKQELERGYALGDRSWYLSCVRAEIILADNIGYSKEALESLEKATLAAKSPWEAFFIGGWILLEADQPTWAAGYLAEAGHRNPTAPIIWLCLGDCFKDLRLFDQAMFYYEKALELEPLHHLALKRQRSCTPKLYGLLRIFRKESLRKQWNDAFNKTQNMEQ